MVEKLKNFLDKERLAALSVVFPDGVSHTAVLHFSYQEEGLYFFFQTSTTSKKVQGANLMSGGKVTASVAIGFSEKEWLTLQLEGDIKAVLNEVDKARIQEIHYARFPNSKKYANDPDNVLLEFTPTWWKFSDYNTEPPKTFSSEDTVL